MTMYRHCALPLTPVRGAALGASLMLRRRNEFRHRERRQQEDLQAWEGEGGSVAVSGPTHDQ
jgi:hypothetical protein